LRRESVVWSGTSSVADRLRALIEDLSSTLDNQDIVRAADQALYRAKAEGRNRTIAADVLEGK
jgi:PleD family two-component response regulator